MKCAEQVRNVYVRAQMWKAIYRYIISTDLRICEKGETTPFWNKRQRNLELLRQVSLAPACLLSWIYPIYIVLKIPASTMCTAHNLLVLYIAQVTKQCQVRIDKGKTVSPKKHWEVVFGTGMYLCALISW